MSTIVESFDGDPGRAVGLAIQQVPGGLLFDFADKSFKAAPTTLTSAFSEAPAGSGSYLIGLDTTAYAVEIPDGVYKLIAVDTSTGVFLGSEVVEVAGGSYAGLPSSSGTVTVGGYAGGQDPASLLESALAAIAASASSAAASAGLIEGQILATQVGGPVTAISGSTVTVASPSQAPTAGGLASLVGKAAVFKTAGGAYRGSALVAGSASTGGLALTLATVPAGLVVGDSVSVVVL